MNFDHEPVGTGSQGSREGSHQPPFAAGMAGVGQDRQMAQTLYQGMALISRVFLVMGS